MKTAIPEALNWHSWLHVWASVAGHMPRSSCRCTCGALRTGAEQGTSCPLLRTQPPDSSSHFVLSTYGRRRCTARAVLDVIARYLRYGLSTTVSSTATSTQHDSDTQPDHSETVLAPICAQALVDMSLQQGCRNLLKASCTQTSGIRHVCRHVCRTFHKWPQVHIFQNPNQAVTITRASRHTAGTISKPGSL